MYFSAASDSGTLGASNGGRLKLANIVRQSLAAKSAYVGPGTGRAETVPNMRVNWLSLYRQRERLAVLVARNFEGPVVVVDAGWLRKVDWVVSNMFAVR